MLTKKLIGTIAAITATIAFAAAPLSTFACPGHTKCHHACKTKCHCKNGAKDHHKVKKQTATTSKEVTKSSY